MLDSFLASTTNTLMGGVVGSHKVTATGYVNIENSQMGSIRAICTSTYHTKQLNSWPKLSASCVVKYSQLSAVKRRWSQLNTIQIFVDI